MGIRPAKSTDLSSIQALNQEIFEHEIACCDPAGWDANYPYEPEGLSYFEKAIQKKDGFFGFMVEENEENIAYMILRIIPAKSYSHRNNIKLAQVSTICVTDKHQGRGIAKKMITFARKWAVEQGATHLKVMCMVENKRARHVYETCGFEEFEVTYEMAL